MGKMTNVIRSNGIISVRIDNNIVTIDNMCFKNAAENSTIHFSISNDAFTFIIIFKMSIIIVIIYTSNGWNIDGQRSAVHISTLICI